MKRKLKRFLDALSDYGEYFFSSGNIKEDYNLVTTVLKSQGYWSGVSFRLYFDDNLNLTSVEERWI